MILTDEYADFLLHHDIIRRTVIVCVFLNWVGATWLILADWFSDPPERRDLMASVMWWLTLMIVGAFIGWSLVLEIIPVAMAAQAWREMRMEVKNEPSSHLDSQ